MSAGPERTPRPDDGTVGVDETSAELERVRAERDAAIAARDKSQRKQERGGVSRRVIVGVLVFLVAVLTPITVTATWAHRTVLNTDAYVSTVAPIAADPAVTAAVSKRITDQLYVALDPQARIADALPPRAAFLAGPIANGAKGTVRDAVNKVLASPQFQQLWTQANRFAHAQLVAVLRGRTKVLQTTDNQVVLNLVPLLNAALANVQSFASGVTGKSITLPTITGNELPSAACQKIAVALSRPVPPTCGQIALFPAAKLKNAQRAVRAFDRAVVALLIITPLIAAIALWVSRRRRRTLLQLTIGAMLGMVIVRRALMWEQNQLVSAARPENRDARSAIVHGVLNGFFAVSGWLVLGLLIVAFLALVTGPYRWAVRTRRAATTTGGATVDLVSAAVKQSEVPERSAPAQAWIRGHFDLLRVVGVVVAVVLLFVFSVNFWGFVAIAALLALYEVGLHRLRPAGSAAEPPAPAPPAQRQTTG